MTPLRSRMMEDMRLAGLASSTQEIYVKAVRGLVAHYRKPPDQLGEEEVRQYLLDVRDGGAARGRFKTCHYGIQFFYRNTLGKDWSLFKKRSAFRSRSGCLRPCQPVELHTIGSAT
ncbi:MAG: phage integrase N-terminal SAM-like domain-containing protein [Alphaproteobacteria bacterium]|nr:phage integrase N-terminal SAM-like domain-containing protein [Alphaproteobacteria bacterium]